MNYRVLEERLHPYADAAVKYFSREYSVKKWQAEAEIDVEVSFSPTLSGECPDKHILCAEIAEEAVPDEMHSFVLECRNRGVPARIWTVVPKGTIQHVATKDLLFVRGNGLGILEIDEKGNGRVLEGPPLSQSVAGLRTIRVSDFPAAYRPQLKSAHDTFIHGNPAKGCSDVYDEIESLTRRIAAKAAGVQQGLKKTTNMNFSKENWWVLLEFLRENLDCTRCSCPKLTKQLFSRLVGMTEYRNQTGHKLKSAKELQERDKQLRTRFESAVDELLTLVGAAAPLRP